MFAKGETSWRLKTTEIELKTYQSKKEVSQGEANESSSKLPDYQADSLVNAYRQDELSEHHRDRHVDSIDLKCNQIDH